MLVFAVQQSESVICMHISFSSWASFHPPPSHPSRSSQSTKPSSLYYTVAAAAAVASLVFNPVRPQRRQPTRLRHPWGSPGKNTGVGCHFLLQCMKVKSERSRLVMSDSLQPHGLQPTRLLRLWDSPAKSTGVGCHCLLHIKSQNWVRKLLACTLFQIASY